MESATTRQCGGTGAGSGGAPLSTVREFKRKFCMSRAFGAAFALALVVCCLPNLATACQITITGVQPGVSNSAAVDCISVQNANVGGDIKNTGSVLQNGITIRDSIVNGTFSNIGSEVGGNIETIVGGISADSKSFIGGGVFPGIEVIGVPNFAGGIHTNATIVNGVYVNGVQTFAGGIVNGGITSGFSISGISHFSGGVTNSGQINFGNYGIAIFEMSDFAGGVFNSGTITSTGFNRAGITLFSTDPLPEASRIREKFLQQAPGPQAFFSEI